MDANKHDAARRTPNSRETSRDIFCAKYKTSVIQTQRTRKYLFQYYLINRVKRLLGETVDRERELENIVLSCNPYIIIFFLQLYTHQLSISFNNWSDAQETEHDIKIAIVSI